MLRNYGLFFTAKDENARLKKRCMRLLEQVQRSHLKSMKTPPRKNSEQQANPPVNSTDVDRCEQQEKTIKSLKFEISKQRKELKELREQQSAATAGEGEKLNEKTNIHIHK